MLLYSSRNIVSKMATNLNERMSELILYSELKALMPLKFPRDLFTLFIVGIYDVLIFMSWEFYIGTDTYSPRLIIVLLTLFLRSKKVLAGSNLFPCP
jgi:hypothetical protein